MASGLEYAVYRPIGRLASYVRAFQALSTKGSARVSVLDFAGADQSVPLRFGDPIAVDSSEPVGLAAPKSKRPQRGPRPVSHHFHPSGRPDRATNICGEIGGV
jgi:hypothetical protein